MPSDKWQEFSATWLKASAIWLKPSANTFGLQKRFSALRLNL